MGAQRILAAAAVLNLAKEIKATAGKSFYSRIIHEEDCNQQMDRWEENHPVTLYVPIALQQLEEISALIP